MAPTFVATTDCSSGALIVHAVPGDSRWKPDRDREQPKQREATLMRLQ